MMNHTFDETEFPKITEYIADMAAEQAYLMLVEHGSHGIQPRLSYYQTYRRPYSSFFS